MAYEAFTDDWAREYGKKLNENAAYKQAGQGWEWPIVLVVEADPSIGLNEQRAVYLDLYHGECREARAATPQDIERVPFVISADPYTWKQVIDGKLEPVTGMIRGKLKLTKGDLSVIARYVLAAKEMVNAATQVPTIFPEGLQ